MITITKEQAKNRFAVIPLALQDALFSVQTAEIISSIGEQYHVPDEKMDEIVALTGWVLLGFMHPEDITREITISTGLSPQIANDVATSLANKIFNPLKLDLDKTYAPLPYEEEAPGPKMIQEITPPQAISMSVPSGVLKSPAPKPPLSGAGWSKLTPEEPVVKLNAVEPGISQKGPSSASPSNMPPAAQSPKPAQPPIKGMGEFERIDRMKGTAAPVMLHEISTPTPLPKSSEIHFNTAPRNEMSAQRPQAPIAKPAIVELGKAADPSAPKAGSYDERKAPAPPTMPSSGPRQITEITAQKQVTAPPPPPPKPPIVKDYR